MHIYEYLFTAVIIVTILLASSTMIEILSEPSRSVSEKEQLKVAAQKLMSQLLLDPGDPPDWGSNVTIDESSLKAFGLAKYSETTREAYALDPDKVYRLNDALLLLNNTRSLFIPPSRVINLLNLGNEYGFALEIFPALNVSIAPGKDSGKYEFSVSSEYGGLPIFGANVTATMYYYDASSQKIASKSTPPNLQTGIGGKCVVDFGSIPTTEMKILTLVVDYYSVRVAKVFPAGLNVKRAHLLGDHLFLSEDETISNNAIQILMTRKAGRYVIENVTSILNIVSPGKFDLTYVEPSAVAILAVSEDGTRLIFTSKEVNLAYSSIPGVWSFPFAYSVERSVIIGGSAYIMRLYLWRMSW